MLSETKLIFSLILIIYVSKVNGYCGPSTTLGLQNTDNFNQVKTNNRPRITTTMQATTLIPNTCVSFNYSTKYFGYLNLFTFSETFEIEVSDIISILVYSAKAVHAIQFNFWNGQSKTYGTIQSRYVKTKIDLRNKEIIAINLRSYLWINNVQFLLHDLSSGSVEWTGAFGGLGGYFHTITPRNIDGLNIKSIYAQNFKITKIYGSVDSHYLTQLRFQYFYQHCSNVATEPKIPPPPSPSPPPTTTILVKTTSLPTTTSLEVGQCINVTDKTSLMGKIGSGYFLSSFDINFADLNSIEVYSGDRVDYLIFRFKNGKNASYGRNLEKYIKVKKTFINLESNQILAINVASGDYVDSIQFLTYDVSKNIAYRWIGVLGGQGGSLTKVDAIHFAPFSSSFQITSLSGYSHPFDGINGLRVGYSYEKCNPFKLAPTIPPLPTLTTIFTPMEISKPNATTIAFEIESNLY